MYGAGFPWCGLLVDVKDLHVRADFMRYDGLRESSRYDFILKSPYL